MFSSILLWMVSWQFRHFPCEQQMVRVWFLIHLTTLCLLICWVQGLGIKLNNRNKGVYSYFYVDSCVCTVGFSSLWPSFIFSPSTLICVFYVVVRSQWSPLVCLSKVCLSWEYHAVYLWSLSLKFKASKPRVHCRILLLLSSFPAVWFLSIWLHSHRVLLLFMEDHLVLLTELVW